MNKPASTLVGPTRENLVLDPLVVQHLNKQLLKCQGLCNSTILDNLLNVNTDFFSATDFYLEDER